MRRAVAQITQFAIFVSDKHPFEIRRMWGMTANTIDWLLGAWVDSPFSHGVKMFLSGVVMAGSAKGNDVTFCE